MSWQRAAGCDPKALSGCVRGPMAVLPGALGGLPGRATLHRCPAQAPTLLGTGTALPRRLGGAPVARTCLTRAGSNLVCSYTSGSSLGRWSRIRPGLLWAAMVSVCTAALRTCLHSRARPVDNNISWLPGQGEVFQDLAHVAGQSTVLAPSSAVSGQHLTCCSRS